MTEMPQTYRVGDATVTRIHELALTGVDPAFLYPDADIDALAEHRATLGPGACDPATGHLNQSIHSWLVRTPHHVILVDTATGNGKDLPAAPVLHRLNEPYLERLAAAGVAPEDVDVVLITHLHADHVGWNTRAQGGRWVPTFPRARHIFSAIEQRYAAALSEDAPVSAPDLPPPALGTPIRTPLPRVYEESVLPVIEAGLAEAITVDGTEVLDGIFFHPTPGHSIDHASIRLVSRGQQALFTGDVMHHPLQVYRPDLRSGYCEFPGPAEASRRWVLEHAAETGALCFSSHFPETAAGHITRRGDRFAWQFA